MRYVQPYGLPDYGAGDGQPYVNGDPTIGQEGSIPPAAAFEHPQREIISLIKKATFTPATEDLEQVTRSVRQQINYAIATYIPGSPNAYSLVLDPVLDQYRPGLTLRVKIPVACTGPTTLNIDNLGTRPIRRANGADTSADDLLANMVVDICYDGAAWQILNFQGFTSSTVNNNTYIVDIPYCVDVGSVNHIVAPFSPALTSTPPGKLVLVKVGYTNTGNVDIAVNALAVKQVINTKLLQLSAGDIIPGMIIALVYDGTKWQMISVPASSSKVMTGPMSLYVNGNTGSDTLYDGRSPTISGSTGPFKTITKAVTEMARWTNWGFVFSIFVADWTYNERVLLPPINGSGECYLIGNDANPQNVLIQDPEPSSHQTACMQVDGTNYLIHGFKFQSNNGGGLVALKGDADVYNLEFGLCGFYHMCAQGRGSLTVAAWRVPTNDAKIKIAGSAMYHILASGIFNIVEPPYQLPDLIITQSVSFTEFVHADGGASMIVKYRNITNPGNVVSGKKFAITENTILATGGRGVNYLPGPSAGTTASGAQYT